MTKTTFKGRFFMQAAACFTLFLAPQTMSAADAAAYSGATIASEGAWCWFADPRAMHYASADGNIDNAYIGYIDVHGNVKASMFDHEGNQSDVLIRSYFQPDDHDNPTFLTLADGRIMIFYTRHTDEACFYYRISQKPGDITQLGEEKKITVANNTTYPSPFILSDDPDHIYLCWRGIGWHPTIAKLSMPDEDDNVTVEYGPYQMVQSTGARPYAKYQSNGKDKIYVSYTTGHPDNESPNWLYFNVININAEKQDDGSVKTTPKLCDLNGKVLSTIANGKFNVNKTDAYKQNYSTTILDAPTNYRDWVWQITTDKNENPVVAMVRISSDKNSHEYYYARWNGKEWKLTDLANGGGRFHSSNTEYCYSGGMSIDPDSINNVYLSIPTAGTDATQKVYEIWKYVVDDNGSVTNKIQITRNSAKNNVRPFVLPGSAGKPLRLAWMNGDYYYWIVCSGYPKGYPTSIMGDFTPKQTVLPTLAPVANEKPATPLTADGEKYKIGVTSGAEKFTLTFNWQISESAYGGQLMKMGDLVYGVNKSTLKPYVKIGEKYYHSQNVLGTSDAWTSASGTDGKWYLTKLKDFNTAITSDGKTLTVYRNGLIDQRITLDNPIALGDVEVGGYTGQLNSVSVYEGCLSQAFVNADIDMTALDAISIPGKVNADIVLPTTTSDNKAITWTSDREDVLTADGFVRQQAEETQVKLTATTAGGNTREWTVTVMPRNIEDNIVTKIDEADLSNNTATGFSSNAYIKVEKGVLKQLRSYTVVAKVNAKSLSSSPRIFDFGSGSSNSLFLRANPLTAGIKYNGAATEMVNSPKQLSTNKDYLIAATFDAETKTTRIFIDGEEVVQGTACQTEPWQLAEVAEDTRNYIGRTQWWDTSYASDNIDFKGVISQFRIFNTDLTREEICKYQGIAYNEKELSTELVNGDFEGAYSVMDGTGVSSDRAIYKPEGWTIDYATGNNNDITALKDGDLYYSFFKSFAAPSEDSKQSYWIRHKWGTPTLSLKQDLRLPEGGYTLTADVWKSGLGGDVSVYVLPEGGEMVKAASLENKEAWQKVSIAFTSDGKASTTVCLSAIHTSSGSEKFIGFDNVKITADKESGISGVGAAAENVTADGTVYSLSGHKVKQGGNASDLPAGVYIQNSRKILVK